MRRFSKQRSPTVPSTRTPHTAPTTRAATTAMCISTRREALRLEAALELFFHRAVLGLPDPLRHDVAFGVDEKRGGDDLDPERLPRRTLGAVERDGVGDLAFLHEAPHLVFQLRSLALVDRDPDHRESVLHVFGVEFLEPGHRLHARLAPSGPEVEKNGAPV